MLRRVTKGKWRLALAAGGLVACALVVTAVAAPLLPASAPASAPRLVVSLTFDDGLDNQATTAAPILASHGMHGTFFVPTGLVGTSGYMTWSQVSALAGAGNEIGGHTVDHVHLTQVTSARARYEICADRDTLLSHGLAVSDFAYPYGESNAAVETVAQECGYNSARTTSWFGASCGKPCTEAIPPVDPYATTIMAFGGTQTLADIESNITTAETYGGWAQIVMHGICDNCGVNGMSPADLSALLDWLQPRAANGTLVETVGQVIGGPVNPPVDPSASAPSQPSLTSASGGSGSVALQWSAPASDGGSAITGYNVYRGTSSGGETLLKQVGTVTSYTDSTAVNGTPYFYEVSAVNAVGESVRSGELSATAGVTSVIASDQFERSVAGGFGSPDVGAPWKVSSTAQTKVANGEGAIYGWTSGNKDIQAWIPTTANDMDVLARVRLSAQSPVGASYQARVVARAQTDTRSGYTAVITHTTAGAVKWSLNRVVNAGGTDTLTLGSGTLLASGGDGTSWWIRLDVQGTQIKVRYWQDGTTEPSTWKASLTDSYWTSGFPALGVYVGSGLTSPFPDTGFDSFTAKALNLAPSVPLAPTLASATGGSGSVALQWSPASDGGSAITGYNVYRGTSSGGETLLKQVGTVTSYTDSTAVNGTPYFYEVSAVNAVGEGARSGELSATAGGTIVLASDQFERTVAGGFGAPDAGPPWKVSSTAQTKVANGQGVIYGWTSGNKDIQAWIPTTANDMDVLARVRLSAQSPIGASYQARVVARAQTDTRSGYTAVITHTTAGAVKWSLNRVVNAGGTDTLTLGSGTLLASGGDGTSWWIRLDVQGTQIKVRYWQDGTTEPSTWKASLTDSYWTSGFPALGVYVGSGLTSPFPDTGFDSLLATSTG